MVFARGKMVDTTEIEEIQLTLEAKICAMDMDMLMGLAVKLKVAVEGLRKLQLSKKIRERIETDVEECEGSEAKKKCLEGFVEMVEGPPPLEGDFTTAAKTTKKEIEKETTQKPQKLATVDIGKVLKRELKIHGQITAGEPHNEGLSFVSLVRQIDGAVKLGYSESEVVEAVIRAVSPALKLRSYLEMIPDLSLSRLRQILRAHFKQKSGTELYQELSVLCQAAKESPQEFLIRAMNLRQQITFASQATDSSVKYEAPLVQSLFIHVVETGLQQESIRAKLRPLLEKANVSDEELMERINTAVSAETERLNKMGSKKSPQVSHVDAQSTDTDQGATSKGKPASKEAKPNKLVATLEAVQSDLASLREEFRKSQVTARECGPREQPSRRMNLCHACQDAGEQRCGHCYKCGSEEHFARGCKKNRNQGNSQGLRQGDRV